jgi:hypothetical protein
LRDIDIRRTLHRTHLSVFQNDPNTIIIDELGLSQGDARIDIAVINGNLHGIEIKSERDTLERLPSQEKIYSKILDTVTLVTGENHIQKATEMVPNWWGIILAKQSHKNIELKEVRPARTNQNIEPYSVAQLLWRDESLAILTSFNLANGIRGKPRSYLWEVLADNLPLDSLCSIVRETLKKRQRWRVG